MHNIEVYHHKGWPQVHSDVQNVRIWAISSMSIQHFAQLVLWCALTHQTCLCIYFQPQSPVPSTSVATCPGGRTRTRVSLERDQSLISWAASPHPPGCCDRPGHGGGHPERRGNPEGCEDSEVHEQEHIRMDHFHHMLLDVAAQTIPCAIWWANEGRSFQSGSPRGE